MSTFFPGSNMEFQILDIPYNYTLCSYEIKKQVLLEFFQEQINLGWSLVGPCEFQQNSSGIGSYASQYIFQRPKP